jgi:hypothetical protein
MLVFFMPFIWINHDGVVAVPIIKLPSAELVDAEKCGELEEETMKFMEDRNMFIFGVELGEYVSRTHKHRVLPIRIRPFLTLRDWDFYAMWKAREGELGDSMMAFETPRSFKIYMLGKRASPDEVARFIQEFTTWFVLTCT